MGLTAAPGLVATSVPLPSHHPVLPTLPCAGLTFLTVLPEVLLSRPMAQPPPRLQSLPTGCRADLPGHCSPSPWGEYLLGSAAFSPCIF